MKYLSAFILAATLFAAPLAAHAGDAPAPRDAQSEPPESACVPHSVAEEQLAKFFNEKVIGLGVGRDQDTVIELYVSSHGSWTILVTMTDGMSCIAASGENWTTPDELAGLAS